MTTNGTHPASDVLTAAMQVPFSQEAEEAVIGAVLVNPASFSSVAQFLRSEDFYFMRNAYIWNALFRLSSRNEPTDYLTLSNELHAMGHLDEIGGQAYLTHLAFNVPTSMHAEIYGRIVERSAVRRRLIIAGDEIRRVAMDETLTVEDTMGAAMDKLSGVAGHKMSQDTMTISDALAEWYDEFETRIKNDVAPGIQTGIKAFDNFGLLLKQSLVLLAGRPGMGKTALMLALLLGAAKRGARVAYFSVEMSRNQNISRMISIDGAIGGSLLQDPRTMKEAVISATMNKVSDLSQLPIFIDDSPILTPSILEIKIRYLQQRHGIDLVCVDGLYEMQLDKSSSARGQVEKFSELGARVKQIARVCDIPLFMTHQLSRDIEKRQDKRPVQSDLRESGVLEQKADSIVGLYRDVVYNPDTEFPNAAELLCMKNRFGATGRNMLYWDGSTTRFVDAEVRTVRLPNA